MKNKKILFLSHDSELNGAERCLLELVSHLDPSEFEPLVLLPWPGPLEGKLKQENIPYWVRYIKRWIPSKRHASGSYAFRYIKGWRGRLWSLLHLIERENVDLVYSNTSTILDGALAARRAGIPHIWHIHEYLRSNADLHSYLPLPLIDRITLALSDRIITPSRALAESRFPGSAKVRVIPNGIDLDAFQAGDGSRIRAELDIPGDAPVVTWIGGISRRKDPLTFAKAAALIYRQRQDVRFLLIGKTADPKIERQIRHRVTQEGLSDCFHILGLRDDVPDLLAAATVHVSTSIQESFGRTLIEAMAAGKPVVATRCGGPEEIVIDGETGFIVESGSAHDVAHAMLTLLNNPEVARRMGETGRQRAKEKFSVKAYTDGISTVISEVCDE